MTQFYFVEKFTNERDWKEAIIAIRIICNKGTPAWVAIVSLDLPSIMTQSKF